MPDYFNEHFRAFIQALNTADVEYILVGGMAVILHGYVRGTGDMDIWVNKTKENYKHLVKAFSIFSMPVFDMDENAFLGNEFDVWGFGRKPVRIEILSAVKGLSFKETFQMAQWHKEDDFSVRFIHINHLITAKKAAARFRDLDDIEQLTRNKKSEP